jgi:pSer/pThr/pTyr-binding forkhead associated (FHA) protein
LPLDDKTVSARHARLAYHHGQWWLEDLRSRNGTFLNTKAVHEPLVLATGDEVQFGSLKFLVLLDESRVMGLKSGI